MSAEAAIRVALEEAQSALRELDALDGKGEFPDIGDMLASRNAAAGLVATALNLLGSEAPALAYSYWAAPADEEGRLIGSWWDERRPCATEADAGVMVGTFNTGGYLMRETREWNYGGGWRRSPLQALEAADSQNEGRDERTPAEFASPPPEAPAFEVSYQLQWKDETYKQPGWLDYPGGTSPNDPEVLRDWLEGAPGGVPHHYEFRIAEVHTRRIFGEVFKPKNVKGEQS